MSQSFITANNMNNNIDIVNEAYRRIIEYNASAIDIALWSTNSCREVVLSVADEFQNSSFLAKTTYLWVGTVGKSSRRIRKEYDILFELFGNMIEKILDTQKIDRTGAKLYKTQKKDYLIVSYGPLSKDLVPDKLIVVNIINAFTKAFVESIVSYDSTLYGLVHNYKESKNPNYNSLYKQAFNHGYKSFKVLIRTFVKGFRAINKNSDIEDIIKSGIITYNIFKFEDMVNIMKHVMKVKLPDQSMKRSSNQSEKCGTGAIEYFRMYGISIPKKDAPKRITPERDSTQNSIIVEGTALSSTIDTVRGTVRWQITNEDRIPTVTLIHVQTGDS